jgi:FKBP12-rapamycin complex-associated protein
MNVRESEVLMPGMYGPKQPQIYIAGFYEVLTLINSKRKPRKVKIFGTDGKSYDFLLKGHEDLRQDERVMQSLSLVNTLLKKNDKTERKNLGIITYPVIPISTNTGLLGWVHHCDTLIQLVVDHRKSNHTIRDAEFKVLDSLVHNSYQQLYLTHKLEVFRYIMENTRGDDLKKSLWMKSQNAEVWLERRTNYVRSLATMSIVGYILGLGDRHLSNIMMQRSSGKIVHIDFGDLFEVTMMRKELPERVPFRLTRLLIKAMEACGIDGNYTLTCINVMEMIRENRDSLLAILESFVTDPLLNWKLITNELATANLDTGQPGALKQSIKQTGLLEVL